MSLTPSIELKLDPWCSGWQVVRETESEWHMYRNTGYAIMNFTLQKKAVYGTLAETLLGWLQ